MLGAARVHLRERDGATGAIQKKDSGRARRRRFFAGFVSGLCVALVAVEIICRFWLGLGDPPLSRNDSDMGYVFQANQDCHRFGNWIHYNAYSMRSDDFPVQKACSNELRVMAIGNSVINGGALTDQRQVCTTILQNDLSRRYHRPVVVGNISAGGWGPLNQWPYVRRYGLYQADILLITLNSGSAGMVFQGTHVAGTDPSFPACRPWCATWESVTRYLLKFLPTTGPSASNEGFAEPTVDPGVAAACAEAIRNMKMAADRVGARTAILLHWTQAELLQRKKNPGWCSPGHQKIIAIANELSVPVVDLGEAEMRAGSSMYRDDIHPNAKGQQVLAQAMVDAVDLLLAK